MNLNDVALVIGHDHLKKGAYSPIIEQSEYDYNKEVAQLVGCDIYTHSPNASYSRKMKDTYSGLSHYYLTIEMHFNAAIPQASGCECLYYHSNSDGKEYSQKFVDQLSAHYDTRNRGIRGLSNKQQRGYGAIASGSPTGILIEPFFGSNIEAGKFEDITKYAKFLTEFILSL